VTTTSDLIRALSGNLTPVRRLRPPLVRALLWLMLAALVLGLLAVSQGVRPDLLSRLQDLAFAGCVAGSLATGVLAAITAFMVSLPDRSRLWLLLPLPALLLWFGNIGYQCLTQWIALDPSGITLGETARCFATLVLTSLPLSLAMVLMLRYAALLRPTAVALVGSLSVAAITATALSLFHVLDASLMVIMWNMGTALLIVLIGGALSRRNAARIAPPPAGRSTDPI
jgi:hypothetical protein